MRWLLIAIAALGLGGVYLYESTAQAVPEPGMWEFRVDKPAVTSKGLSDEERAHFRTAILREFEITTVPAFRNQCLSEKAIRGLRDFQAEAVPAGFVAGECSKRDPSGKGRFDSAGQCRKANGSIELGYDASFKTAADQLTVDVNLDYRFADDERGRSTAGMMLRIEGRRIGDCSAGDDRSIADIMSG